MTTKTISCNPFNPYNSFLLHAPCFSATLLCAALCLLAPPARAATNDLTSAIQRGLFEEEANQNLGAAIQAYQTVASQFDRDRKLAATAIFRLGECYRKQGNTNDAATQYERILREFSDQPTLVTLSRQNLAALGSAPAMPAATVISDAARQEQKRLLEEEIKLVQKQLDEQKQRVQNGTIAPGDLLPTEREILKLKRQLAALDAGLPVFPAAADTSAFAAEAEAAALEAQFAELKSAGEGPGTVKDGLRRRSIVVQQNFPNPVLTSLMQKRAEAEQKLAELQKDYGPQHAEVVKTVALTETIDRQIDEQVQSILRYLEIKRTAAKKTADMLQAQSAMPSPSAKNLAAGSAPGAATSTEAEEVKRIQALIKDSPDLINAPDQKGETLLQTAAAKGKLAVVKVLLENGAAVDGLQQPGLTALHYAAGNGHKAIVDLLLSKGAKADAQSQSGVAPLHLAARKGYESVAKALLAAGAPVNVQTKSTSGSDAEDLQYHINPGQTPLHLAASAGYSGMVELLLAKGADVNAEDGEGRTALSYAAQSRYQAVLQVLLAAHANPNAGRLALPLAWAAYEGNMPALKLLLANGADPNTNSKVSWSVRGVGVPNGSAGPYAPLFLAASRGQAEAAKELLRFKADPNVTSPSGTPVLYTALSDAPTLKVLLEGGANPNVRAPEGTPSGGAYGGRYPGDLNARGPEGTPLLLQAVKDRNQAAVELLLAHQADVNGSAANGWTPLDEAAAYGLKPIAELLLKGGALVNTRNKNGGTPLEIALQQSQRELVELLLAHQADANAAFTDEWTPLQFVAHRAAPGDKAIAELLLKAGADVNARDKDGNTPLHFAAGLGARELVELLLANKADPNERNNAGQTPLDLAKSQAQSAHGQAPGTPGMFPRGPGAPPGPYTLQGAGTLVLAPTQASKPETMAELLRQHGALDNLPHLDQIGVRRSATGVAGATFTKDAQDWSQFMLLELLAAQYKLLAVCPNDGGGASSVASIFFMDARLPFPDLAHVHISHPSADLKSWQDQVVDLRPVMESGDCAKDVRLRWGDVVEIPESDHPLNERWQGFSRTELAQLKMCLTRKVQIVVKGQVTPVTLAPQITDLEEPKQATNAVPPSGATFEQRLRVIQFNQGPSIRASTPFWLKSVLLQSKLVLVSSDLSRVKVTRLDPATGLPREWIVDCAETSPAPAFWLQNGDRIEVPEKGYASAEEAMPAPPWSPAPPGAPVYSQRLQNVIQRAPAAPPGGPAAVQFSQRLQAVIQRAPSSPSEQPLAPSAPGPDGKPPLFQALPDAPTLKALLEDGADPNVRTSNGTPLLVQAVRDKSQVAVELLLSHKADVNAADSDGWTPLDYATADGLKAIVELLLKAGATVNARNPSGETALHIAVRGGQRELAELLLAHKADPNVRNNAGQTPLALAQSMGLSLRMGGAGLLAPASESPQTAEEQYLRIGGVVYSPKTDDPELLKDGYHKDRSARTRQAEVWEARAVCELSGRACPAVWTGTDMVVFGGEGMGTSFDNGARYCLAEDTWAMLPSKGAPSSRTGHVMVWTGKEVIIWGGFGGLWGNNTNRNDGARYNPASDTWKPVSTKNAPASRFDFPAAWTGREMLVWGGFTDSHSRYQGLHADAHLNSGGRYDLSSDSWKTIPTRGAPSKRCWSTMVWTGKEMIIWGGCNATKALGDGGRYSPARDAWRPVSTDGAPSARLGHVAVWTGKEMIVWGGTTRETDEQSVYFENGARYNPETDTWRPISTVGAPKGRVSTFGVWTGTEMFIWGGVNDAQGGGTGDPNRYVGTGGRYNPATDTWTEMTTTGAPPPRLTCGVWTGEGLLTFGGYNGTHLNDTWFYSPSRTLYPYVKE